MFYLVKNGNEICSAHISFEAACCAAAFKRAEGVSVTVSEISTSTALYAIGTIVLMITIGVMLAARG